MAPNDPDLTHTSSPEGIDPTRDYDPSEAALDAGLVAAFGGDTTHHRPTPAEPEAGTVIDGKYRLTEKVGVGGMGSVWVAHQSEPVKRKVAIKLIKLGMDSKAVLARFDAERQALAVMDHPNIAKVLDGGLHDGRPYFAMELVKGVSITQFCDERKLTPQQRLELFVPVCQAIQHAHQKGVIHRDIKPSNVLIALYDDKPVPKVIDFGVAKATGSALTEHSLETGFGAVLGTPQYMSPEQASLNNLDIDTRSDVYSLGVLLYELLTGSPPFSRRELDKKGLLEILRVVREEEPPRPSDKLSTADALPSLAAFRGTEPKALTGLLRNELDWIVMKALEKDRARRYETANGFAADVLRYLVGEPVQAHPPSASYRLKKFVRKHRVQVTAAALVLLTLVGGIVGTTLGLLEAMRQEGIARGEVVAKEAARAEEARQKGIAETAEKDAKRERDAKALALEAETKARQQAFRALRSITDDVVQRKFSQGAVLTDDDKTFLRGVIAQYDAFAAIQGDDAESRATRAEGRARVGLLRHNLGELKEAEQDYNTAVDIYQQLAAEYPTRPEYREELAKAHHRRVVLRAATSRLKEAEGDSDAALDIQKRLVAAFPDRSEYRKLLADIYTNRSNLRRVTGRLKEAEAEIDITLELVQRLAIDFPTRPEFRQQVASGHNVRGILRTITNRPVEAEADYTAALTYQQQLASDFPTRSEYRQELARTHNNRGLLRANTSRPKEAEADFDAATGLFKRLAAEFPSRPEFRQELANIQSNRGDLRRNANRWEEAEADYAAALSLRKQLTDDTPTQSDLRDELAYSFDGLAELHRRQGDLTTAKRLLTEGRPHHLAALKSNPRNPQYRKRYLSHLRVLAAVHAGLLEPEDAIRTAEVIRDLGWNSLIDAYEASRALSQCIHLMAKHEKLTPDARTAAVRFYGDEAMKLIQAAVQKGWQDAAHLRQDADLAPLRERDDFKKLLVDLEAKFPPKKETPPPPEKK